MNYESLIDEQIMNKNGQVGVIASFSEERITVRFGNEEKTYDTRIAFKNGFLSFPNKELNNTFLMYINLLDRKEAKLKQDIDKNRKDYLKKREMVNEAYRRLYRKNEVLLFLFGKDFVYPPFKRFVKKYYLLIEK